MPFRFGGRARAQRHYERALRYYDEGEIALAIADLDEAIKNNRRQAKFFAARGLLLVEWGDLAGAEADFQAALQRDRDDTLAHYGLGMVAHAEKRYEDAIHHFTRAIECAPERGEPYYYRSVCHYEMGALDQAEVDMDFARQLLLPEDARQLDAARWMALYRREREKIRRRSPRNSA